MDWCRPLIAVLPRSLTMKFIYKIGLILTISTLSNTVSAAYFSTFIYEMMSEESFIAKSVLNDTKTSNMYQISSYKIDKPGKGGENHQKEQNRDLIYTPVKLKIESGMMDFFKILYIGPKDNKERYYRVVFLETPLTGLKANDVKNTSSFFPTVSMSTILIVRPRQQVFKYELDEKLGVITNTGNTFFRLIIQQGCNGTDDDSNQLYILPGESYKNVTINSKNKKYIVVNKKYVRLGEACFTRSKAH